MKYKTILCDPPWDFKTYSKKNQTRSTENHYSTMVQENIVDISIDSYIDDDCSLFMWTVGTHLPNALEVGKSWGFTYKTDVFYWNKGSIGLGYWSRKQVEQCLLFTKGHPKRLSKGVPQLITAKRREHSRKPDEIYERIEALVSGPYLEMFARQKRPGWDVWGNEVDKFEYQAKAAG